MFGIHTIFYYRFFLKSNIVSKMMLDLIDYFLRRRSLSRKQDGEMIVAISSFSRVKLIYERLHNLLFPQTFVLNILISNAVYCCYSKRIIRLTRRGLRSLPRRPSNFTSPHVRNNLRQSATTLRLHGNADGYCTVGRTYEEIPVRRSDSETIFEDISAIHDRQVRFLLRFLINL